MEKKHPEVVCSCGFQLLQVLKCLALDAHLIRVSIIQGETANCDIKTVKSISRHAAHP